MMKKIKRKIKLFKLFEKLKQKNIYAEINNLHLLNEEIKKSNLLLEKIENIILDHSKNGNEKNFSGALFKNKSKIISVMSNQKSIAKNKKDFLLEQKMSSDYKIANLMLQKSEIQNKIKNKIFEYSEIKETKSEVINTNLKKR